MKPLLIGVLIGICIPIVGGLAFVKLGGMPVATSGGPLPFERSLARMAIHAAIKDHEDTPSPIALSEEALVAGAKIYAADCAVCHGRPDQPASAIAKGMFPDPPQLFDAKEMVTDDPVGEVFWKAKNGLRLTGMPGFGANRTDEQLWQVSLLLTKANTISENVKKELSLGNP